MYWTQSHSLVLFIIFFVIVRLLLSFVSSMSFGYIEHRIRLLVYKFSFDSRPKTTTKRIQEKKSLTTYSNQRTRSRLRTHKQYIDAVDLETVLCLINRGVFMKRLGMFSSPNRLNEDGKREREKEGADRKICQSKVLVFEKRN